jgi:hypothetical protein
LHKPLLGNAALRADNLDQQLAGVLDPKRHGAGRAHLNGGVVDRVYVCDWAVGAPFDFQLLDHVDEVDFAVERRHPAERGLEELPDQRQILRFQSVTAGREQVQGLAVHEENGFLALVDDQLGPGVEVFQGMFPDKCVVAALVLYHSRDGVGSDFFGYGVGVKSVHNLAKVQVF